MSLNMYIFSDNFLHIDTFIICVLFSWIFTFVLEVKDMISKDVYFHTFPSTLRISSEKFL